MAQAGLWDNGIMGGDARVLARVCRDVGSVVEGCSGLSRAGGSGGREDAAVEVWFSDGFAVPAGAFAVDGAVGDLFVHFAGVFEAVGELVFVDFVVVVDEDGIFGEFFGVVDRVVEVAGGGELVRVPG